MHFFLREGVDRPGQLLPISLRLQLGFSGSFRMGTVTQIKDLDSTPRQDSIIFAFMYNAHKGLPGDREFSCGLFSSYK